MRVHRLATALIALLLTSPCLGTRDAAGPCTPGRPPTPACITAEMRDGPSQPEPDVRISPGDFTQKTLDSAPEGAVILLESGVHGLGGALHPRAGQTIVGTGNTVVSGSRVLTDFERDGDLWVADGQTQRLERHGKCLDEMPACDRPENVFIDDRPLEQVLSLDDVEPGRFHFDYDAGRITLADDPSGRTVETTVADAAFLGPRDDAEAPGVTIANLVVEKFGNRAQIGVIDSLGAAGWTIDGNVVRLNHGVGIRAHSGSVVRRNNVVDNGQLGLAGNGEDLLVEHNHVARNGWAGFSRAWEAGGGKWTRTDGLVVRENWVHHNDGPGLWTDIDNIRTRHERNVVDSNHDAGIFHEISYDAVITGNVVRDNGHGDPRWGYGAGIQVAHSPRVRVHGNTVAGNARGITLIQQDRGYGEHGPHELGDIEVHDNEIHLDTGFTGLVQDIGDRSYFTSRDIRFHGNRYAIDGVDEPFAWNDEMMTLQQWRAAGNDVEP